MKKTELLFQFVRFNIIGIINTGITYLLFAGIFYITESKMLGLIGDYSFGILFSFFANRRFTFKAHGKKIGCQLIRMVSTYILIFSINAGLLYLLTDVFGLNTYFAQIVALVFVTILSFLNQKLFVFRKK